MLPILSNIPHHIDLLHLGSGGLHAAIVRPYLRKYKKRAKKTKVLHKQLLSPSFDEDENIGPIRSCIALLGFCEWVIEVVRKAGGDSLK